MPNFAPKSNSRSRVGDHALVAAEPIIFVQQPHPFELMARVRAGVPTRPAPATSRRRRTRQRASLGSEKRRLNRSTIAPARRSQFFSPVATCSASSASSRCMCGFCRRGSFTSVRPGANSSKKPPCRGRRDAPASTARWRRRAGCARVIGRAEIPGEREQHEGVVVGIAGVVERRAFDRDRTKPAAVRRARGADQERNAVPRGLRRRRDRR